MVRIRNLREAGGYDHPGPRLLRRQAVTWAGSLHEQLVRRDRPAVLAALLNLGRSAALVGQPQRAVDAFETVRELGAGSRVGELEEATACLVQAMARHGRIRGRGTAQFGLWQGRPPSVLARLLAETATEQTLPDLAAELRTCPAPAWPRSWALSPPPPPTDHLLPARRACRPPAPEK